MTEIVFIFIYIDSIPLLKTFVSIPCNNAIIFWHILLFTPTLFHAAINGNNYPNVERQSCFRHSAQFSTVIYIAVPGTVI